GVPDRLAVAQAADRCAAHLDVGDHVHFRMLGQEGLAVGIRPRRIELAEELAEREQLRIGEPLAAKAQHEMIEPGPADLRESLRGDRPRQVYAAHFGAEGSYELLDLTRRHVRAAQPICLRKNSSVRERASFALSAWYEPRWSQLKPWPAG